MLTLNDGQGGIATQQVAITITGANDAPLIVGHITSGEVAEDAVASATGTVTFADLDLSDSHGISVMPASAGYLGTFSAALSDASGRFFV